MPEPYVVVRFEMRAVIGEHTFTDVVQFTTSFEANSIPEGAITVAVGKRVDTQAAATIHKAVNDFRIQLPAQVYLRAIILDKDRAHSSLEQFDVPGGKLVFEGFAVGAGWQRTQTSASFTIHLTHWLLQLHYGSAISASAHPSNPADWKYPAAFAAIGFSSDALAGATTPAEVAWTPLLRSDTVQVSDLQLDFWGRVLHKWMLHIAQDDPIESRLTGNTTDTTARSRAVLDALNRLSPNPAGVPLRIDLTGTASDVVAAGLRLALQNETGSSWLNSTLWGKLVGEWSPAYWFAVVPRVADGLIVPFTGGLQGAPWQTIFAADYNHCDLNAQLHQVLRAVGIAFPAMSAVGFNGMSGGVTADMTGLYGWFKPDGLDEGLVLIKDPPQWLCDNSIVHSFVESSTGDVGAAPIGTGLDAAGTGAPAGGTKPREIAETVKANRRLLDRFAQQWYAVEMLKGRSGELSGKLRFDIAPGSNVLIEAGNAVNLSEQEDALTVDVYATVSRVSISINAETGQAGTAFSIAHIRTPAENQSLSTSVPRPPLYLDAWRGASLV